MSKYNQSLIDFLSPNPKEVQGISNSSYLYYRQQLYLKIQSLFKFEDIPQSWDIDYLNDNLWRSGFLSCVEYHEQTYLLMSGKYGINPYNKPTSIIIANPVLGNFEREIGKDGELLYFNYVNGYFASVEPLVKRYALLLAQCDASVNINLMNSRVAHVFQANSDSELKTYQKIYDNVTQGKPAVFLKKGNETLLNDTKNDFLNVKNTYIANDILLTKQTIYHEFLSEIGIDNANIDKRERLNTDEVNSNNYEIKSLVSLWYDNLSRCIERINKTFNLNIKVSYNYEVIKDTEKEVNTNEYD